LNKTSKELVDADTEASWNPYAAFPWGPSIDGVNFDVHPGALYKQGKVNHVPIMAGTNTDEGTLFVYTYYNTSLPEEKYHGFVEGLLNEYMLKLSTSQMAQLYKFYPPATNGRDNRVTAAQMVTDVTFVCSTQDLGQDISSTGKASFFLFRFNHRSGCFDKFLPNIPGVSHTLEIDYTFNTPGSQLCLWSNDEKQLSARTQAFWVNFAKNLKPTLPTDTPGNFSFPVYSDATRQGLVLQTPADGLEQDYRGDQCRFWKEVLYSKYGQEPVQTLSMV
jgi:carboxylesterase type B